MVTPNKKGLQRTICNPLIILVARAGIMNSAGKQLLGCAGFPFDKHRDGSRSNAPRLEHHPLHHLAVKDDVVKLGAAAGNPAAKRSKV